MKKQHKLANYRYLLLLLFCSVFENTHAQSLYSGQWEGIFMEQFKTALLLQHTANNLYSGSIRMFDGNNMIQDDEISRISITGKNLEFRIEAKQTDFSGSFAEDHSELSGNFIFPDQSRHPITLRRVVENNAENESDLTFSEMQCTGFRAAKLRSDLDFLIQTLKENHPQLYQFTSEDTFKEVLKQISDQISDGMTVEVFYRLLAPLIADIQCSHTGIRLPASYEQAMLAYGNCLPIRLFCHQGRAYYLSGVGDNNQGIEPGSEIVSINNIPVRHILNQLLALIPSEGGGDTKKYHEINHEFHRYYYLLDHSESFEIVFQTQADRGKVILQACRFDEIFPQAEEVVSDLPVEYSRDDLNNLAIMKIPSFAIRDMEGYMMLLDSLFLDLGNRDTPHLVLDLRGNQGGHPIFAAQLFSYLTTDEFTYFRRNPKVPDLEPLYHPMQPNENHFRGKMYVLVDGGCLSTTGHLISLLRYHTSAVFVGEEPGSSFSCNDFSMQVTLPHTGIQANIPRTTFETDVSGFVNGTPFPVDHPVSFSIEDLIKNGDSTLRYVRELIGKPTTIP